MGFNEIREKALAEWESLEHSNKTRIIVGFATCGQAAGANAVLNSIESALAEY